MRPFFRVLILTAPPLLALAGCASAGEFPSLAIRPEERDISLEEPVRTPPPVADAPALRAEAIALLERARQGQRAFAGVESQAAQAVRGAGGRGSDSWTAAQEAISALEAARAPTTRALADLDQLLIARAAMPTSVGDFRLIEEAQSEAQSLARAQTARIEALARQVGPR